MSINATTLAGAMTLNATAVTLTSGTGAAVNKLLRVDSEFMLITNVDDSPTVHVARGLQGTKAAAHTVLAFAYIGLPSDFPYPVVAYPNVTTLGASVTISIAAGNMPRVNTEYELNKAGVLAVTLGDPDAAMEGLLLGFMNRAAQANTVTNTTGFNGSGTAGDVATSGGAIGDYLLIQAINSVWNVQIAKGYTLG